MDRALRLVIEAALTKALGRPIVILDVHQASGGCIHRNYQLHTDCGPYFLKLNHAQFADHFAAEVNGLEALQETGIRVPQAICQGCDGEHAYLVLEYLELGDASISMRKLGIALAQMHQHCGSQFGWIRDNYIGATPQHNGATTTWLEFWRERRLLPQFAYARRNGHRSLEGPGHDLIEALPQLLEDYEPSPSLLHGDLWSGNASALIDGTPVLFDPAVYLGDAETDLAMTELFGGFSADFYAGYRSTREIDAGYAKRKTLYQLYHLLNHLNLFGSGYLAQCEASVDKLLNEAG